jgi:gliding motility-associated-like protein
MRLKFIIALLLSTILYVPNSFSQDFQWVRSFEGSYFSGDNNGFIEVDDNENSYTFGVIFEPLFDIDPTSGTQIIDNSPQSTNPQCSIFLTKLDSDGNFLWGKTFGSIFGNMDRVIDMEIGTDGNIYLLADIYEQTSFMQKFITIIKIDPQGNILMTKKITNLDSPNQYDIYSSSSLALDNQNNIFITGSYRYSLKIDPTNPQLNFQAGGDSFLLKMNSSGNILFGRKFNIHFTNTHYESVKIDPAQNPIVSSGDSQTVPNHGYNIFKINANNGSIIWQKFLSRQHPDTFNIDNAGNIIIAARANDPFGGDINVNPDGSNLVFISPSRYLLWLTNNGDFLEVKKYPSLIGFSYLLFTKIEFDTNNNTYVTGEFINAFDADASSNSFVLDYTCGSGGRDAFYIKFDNNRNFENAFKLGDYNCNYINFYFTDFKIKNDNQYYVGNYAYTADFDPTPNTFLLTTNTIFGSRFTLKLGVCNIAPIPAGPADQFFCSSENPGISNLSPNDSSIKWYSSSSSTTPLNGNVLIVDGQTYYAATQIGNCPESSRLAVTAHINQTPQKPDANDQAFCANQNPTIGDLVCNGQDIKWYDALIDGNLLSTNTSLVNNTTYYATQTINNCESQRKTVTVTLTPDISPILNSPQQFCMQQNATLNDITVTGQNIQWYDALTGGNLLVTTTLLQNNVIYYASQNVNGCESARIPVTITIQNTPAPTGNTSQSFCSSANATLNNISIAGTNVLWYSSSVSTQPLAITTLLVDNTTYYATQTINGCESPTRLGVSIDLINTLNAQNYQVEFCDDQNNDSEIIDLASYNQNLIASATGNTFSYYKSLSGAQNQSASERISNFSSYPLQTGTITIYVRIDNMNTCHQIVTLQLALFGNPTIPIQDIMPICEGSSITVDAGSGNDTYNWSTGATSQQIAITAPGNYSVSVTQNHSSVNCSTTKSFTVVNSNIATIENIVLSEWTTANNTITVLLTSNSQGDYVYSLDGVNYQSGNTFENLPSGQYTVYVKDKNGCGITDKDVLLLMYPKFFTPNGDGYNDYWQIDNSIAKANFKILIFDRLGKLLKAIDSHSGGWDGTFNGQPLPSTDYWFTFTMSDGKEYKGHFALKR